MYLVSMRDQVIGAEISNVIEPLFSSSRKVQTLCGNIDYNYLLVTRFAKTCLYAHIIFFLIYFKSLALPLTFRGAIFDATLAVVLTI